MIKEIKQVIVGQLIVSIFLGLITYLLVGKVLHLAAPFAWQLLTALFIVNSVLLIFFGQTSDRNNPQTAIRNVIAFFGLKLMAYLVILLIFFFLFKAFKMQLAILFLLYYVVFSILNVWWLTKKK